jgi:hypothetical protein
VRGAALLAGAAALALLAACHEGTGPGACFESNATPYAFDLNGDTTLVFHWPGSYMPVRVYAEPKGNLAANVQAAMDLWTGAFRCGELRLVSTSDSTRADIIVRNPPSLPTAPRAARVLRADSVGACQGVTQFTLDSAETTLTGPMRSYVAPFPFVADSAAIEACYHFVTAHELGHALGLLAHSPDSNDLMYQQPRRRVLTEADRYTIQLLYHTTSKLGPPARP